MHPFPPPPPGAERRIHPRKDVIAQVELMWGEEVVITTVNNLSLGGAFLLHDGDEISVGDDITVQLSSDTVDVVQRARVVRVSKSEPRGVAVSWVEPRAKTYAIIERLMREEAAAPPRPVVAPAPPQLPAVRLARGKGKKRNKSQQIQRP